jgi:hypothetical protein
MNPAKDRGPTWLDYAGKRIIFVDYSYMSGPELVDLIKKARAEIVGAIREGEKGFYSLVDVTETVIDGEATSLFREAGTVMADGVAASVVVGIQGIKKHILRFVNILAPLKTESFDTIEEAKAWIAKQ